MRSSFLVALAAAVFAADARASDTYGARGLFPVYSLGNQWLIFDKPPQGGAPRRAGTAMGRNSKDLLPGSKFLVVGSAGANLFVVARSSPTYGGVCRNKLPTRLRAALLKGPRSAVGDPVLAIKVSNAFSLKGSHARYETLGNTVDEPLYVRLGAALSAAAVEEGKSGAYRFRQDDEGAAAFLADPRPERVTLKIDFVARPRVAGLLKPTALVTGAQISSAYRRCLRLADGDKLIGACVEMPHDLMAETAQLRFVAYDPSGTGNPFLLAYTHGKPLWGHERWGFVLRREGARLFLHDALDPGCREGF